MLQRSSLCSSTPPLQLFFLPLEDTCWFVSSHSSALYTFLVITEPPFLSFPPFTAAVICFSGACRMSSRTMTLKIRGTGFSPYLLSLAYLFLLFSSVNGIACRQPIVYVNSYQVKHSHKSSSHPLFFPSLWLTAVIFCLFPLALTLSFNCSICRCCH